MFRSKFLQSALTVLVFNALTLSAEDKKPEVKTDKPPEGYDFFQEDALKTMDGELENFEKNNEDTKTIKGLFIQRGLEDKDKDGSKKKGQLIYRNVLVTKKVKLHLSGGEVIQGETPFNGDKINLVSEKDGVRMTHEIIRADIVSLEFLAWKPFREATEPYQGTDFKVKKYYFLPSVAKLTLASGAKIEGQIDPFELLTFPIQSDTGRAVYGAYFADTLVPTRDIAELLKDKIKNQAALESLDYKWLIANTADAKYYEKNMPKRTIKKIEFMKAVEQPGKNETSEKPK